MDEANKRFTLGGKVFTEGSEISIDGSTGKIYEGLLPTADAVIAGEFSMISKASPRLTQPASTVLLFLCR